MSGEKSARSRAETLDTEPCHKCNGTGNVEGTTSPCEHCYGSGRIFVGRKKQDLEPSEMIRVYFNGHAEQTRVELRTRDAGGDEVVSDIPCSALALVADTRGAKLVLEFDAGMFEVIVDGELRQGTVSVLENAAKNLSRRS